MNLAQLKGSYDVIFSLGHNCLPADQLARHVMKGWGRVRLGGLSEKIERRVPRFLQTLLHANRILYIRTERTIHETAELMDVLKGMVSAEFNLLVINHAPVHG